MISQFQNIKVVYRRYAGLYFVFGVDITDNELLLMETIHLFVELLDQYFSNVCEVSTVVSPHLFTDYFIFLKETPSLPLWIQLDIVFHFNKVYNILDEFILAGEVQETSKRVILDRMQELEKLE